MPVSTLHPQYEQHLADWCLMRDVVKGHKSIQKAGEKYLPKLQDQTPEEYKAYKERAPFFNATGRVKDTLVGMVFRKDPQVESTLKDILEDVTLTGVPFNAFLQSVAGEVMEVNRVGVLIDFPTVQQAGEVVTLAVAERQGLRVYARTYLAESIINWRTTQVGGKTVLSMVVLSEKVEEVNAADPFEVSCSEQHRVLELVGGTYTQSIYNGDGQLSAQYTPLMNGKPLDYIPFVFFSSEGSEPEINDPMMYDLAVVNLAHYRNTADMEHGLHYTGLPTAFIAGANAGDQFRIGSATAWVFTSPDAKAAFLEFKGEGLGQLRTGIQDKEQQMAALGARMLAPEKKDAEAADTIAQKRQGEISSLGAAANAISRGATRILQIMSDWSGATGKVSVKLNTDYLAIRQSPQEITALLQSVMSGNLSSQSFYEALVRGEIISGARTFQEEQTLIAEDAANKPDVNERDPGREAAK